MKLTFYLLIFAIIIFASCEREIIEKEIEIEIEKQFSWQLDSRFLHDSKIQLNSYTDDENLHTLGVKYFSTLKPNRFDTSKQYFEHALISSDYTMNYKWPISSRLFVDIENSFVRFHASRDPVFHNGKFYLSMKDFDSLYTNIQMPKYFNGDALGLNNQLQCLIPYSRYIDESRTSINNNMYFALIDLELYNENPDLIDTLSSYRFTIDQTSPYYQYLVSITTIDKNFFITYTNKTFKVTSDRQVTEVFNEPIFRIIKLDNTLFGITDDALYKSDDQGNSWHKISAVQSFMSDIHYKVIDNEVFGFYYSQLFKIDFGKNEIKEIVNDGLEGHRITSICKFKDKIYVTTFSGVFYKEWEKFLTFKEIPE